MKGNMDERQSDITKAFETVDRIIASAELARRSDGTSGDAPMGVAPHVADLRNYSLDGLNIKGAVPLERIVQAVRRFRSGAACPDVSRPRLNILLMGVPGSGKTAFVEYLAHSVGAPLRTLGASDLLSKWIGEGEKILPMLSRTRNEKGRSSFLTRWTVSCTTDLGLAIHGRLRP